MDAVSNVPPPLNEPVRAYAPGSAERAAVEAKIKELAASPVELTMAVGGQQRMGGGDRRVPDPGPTPLSSLSKGHHIDIGRWQRRPPAGSTLGSRHGPICRTSGR